MSSCFTENGSREEEEEMAPQLLHRVQTTLSSKNYDTKLDNKDELWVHMERKGRDDSDAVLTCPACFSTLCVECQRAFRLSLSVGLGVKMFASREDMESTSRYTELYSSPTERSRLIKFCDQVIKNQRPVITSGRDGGGIDEVGASTKETFQPVWCIVLQPEANVRGSSKTSGLFLLSNLIPPNHYFQRAFLRTEEQAVEDIPRLNLYYDYRERERKGRDSVAFPTCPTCFTTLFLACKKHEKYLTQYIAVFVGNCKIKISQILRRSYHKPKTSDKGGRDHGG
ncbi:hypothetical protein C5167_025693 [Papaver somniferum]|uniref:E2F-associated phosphoprotein n=1 Tax=Papaver somniferum TaxID=3469 RepID=A0A4Y7JS91_PAPSO|nr:hypothetical protein C5167_025693 [Papaver somniferum]